MVDSRVPKGICKDFQLGSCSQRDHHRDQNCLQLHICAPCMLIRGDLVEHKHYSPNCTWVGAVGCPYQMTLLPPPPIASPFATVNSNLSLQKTSTAPVYSSPVPQETSPIRLLDCEVCEKSSCKCTKFHHKPTIKCRCNSCMGFFYDLSNDFELFGFSEIDDYFSYHSDDEDDEEDECRVCMVCCKNCAYPWCQDCVDYFGNYDNYCSYMRELDSDE